MKTIVVGDVHGHFQELKDIFDEVVYSNDDVKVILLGDLVDRGPDSGKTIAVADALQKAGRLQALIVGNHEHKLYRKFMGRDVKLGPEAQRSFESITSQGMQEAFMSLVGASYVVYGDTSEFGYNLFVHGALPSPYLRVPDMGNVLYTNYLRLSKKLSGYLEPAFYGYTDGTTQPDGFPTRLMDWLDRVPNGVTVWKGHDAMYPEIHIHSNQQGGTVVFMDTGSGKEGGKLSWSYVP